MKRTITFLLIFSVLTSISNAGGLYPDSDKSLLLKDNNTSLIYKKKFRRKMFAGNTFFIEGAGLAYKWSINYDRILEASENYMLTARLGYGMYTGDNNLSITKIPATINFLYGNKHFLEVGAGTVYTTEYKTILPAAQAGYRFQNRKGGIVVRLIATVTYEPHYSAVSGKELYREFIPYGGLSLGYSF